MGSNDNLTPDTTENTNEETYVRTPLEKFFLITKNTPSFSMMIRFLAGFYCLYTAYQVLPPSAESVGNERIFVWIMGIFFIIAGIYLIGAYFAYHIAEAKRNNWKNPNLHQNDNNENNNDAEN